MNKPKPHAFKVGKIRAASNAPLAVKLSLGICLLLGLLFLILSATKFGRAVSYVGTYIPDLEHDLGVALIISFVVASLFELYRSTRHQMESMKDVIDFAMGDLITGEVWRDVQALIENKTVIRRNVRLRLEFQPESALQLHESILRVEHEYDIWSLRNRRSKFKIVHELDYQFRNERLKLPAWVEVLIDPPESKTDAGWRLEKGEPNLEIEVKLAPRRDEESIFVRTVRSELAHIPGSYNFYTPEFMKGLRLAIVGCPANITIEVWIRPHGGGEALVSQDYTWSYDQLIFPGQGIEIKFISSQESQAATAAPAVVIES
jgi:hypothetical protein